VRALAMPTARRLGLFLLLVFCAPLMMAAGGGPDDRCRIGGFTFKDRNANGIQDPFDRPSPMTISFYDATTTNLVRQVVADPGYAIAGFEDVCERSFIICAVLQSNWTQTLPSIGGADVVSCAGFAPDLAPLGYRRTLGEFDSAQTNTRD
jgi:hypothetical protein